jgi:hypothetical protein
MKRIFTIVAILFAINGNAQWVQMNNGMDTVTAVSFASSGNNIFAGTYYGIYVTTNAGSNWTKTSFINDAVFSMLVNGNKIFAGTWHNGIYLSTNNGMNWYPTTMNVASVFCLANIGNNIFAGTELSGAYISTDNGTHWVQTPLRDTSINCFAISGNKIAAGTNSKGVYISSNNGANWTQTALNNKYILSLAYSGNNIYAGTVQNGIYVSTNDGVNWTQSLIISNPIYALTMSGSNIIAGIYQYSYSGIGGVHISTNNGTSWIPKNQGFNLPIIQVYAMTVVNNYIFTGLYKSTWRRTISEIMEINNISTEAPSKYSLGQNYPNPFNPMCNVQFSMYNAGQVKLVVYNVMGREVQTLVNEKLNAGTYEVKFDGSMLNSGVYFYRLVTKDFSETKRMLLIK